MGLYDDILKTQAEVNKSQDKSYETTQSVSSADVYRMGSGVPSMYNFLSQSQGRPINESGDGAKQV